MYSGWTEVTFQNLLESAPDAMVIVEKGGTIVLVNSQTERIFGYSKQELVGQKIEFLLPSRYKHSHVDQRDSYFSNPHVRPMGSGAELFGCRKDGSEFPVEISLSPLQTEQGLLVTSAIRDISERKKIEKELRDARSAADAANRAKSEFLANMSHEIRTPLSGILGYAEMLLHYCRNEQERKDYCAKIKRNADNLTELINDILDLSKVEAGALEVECLAFPFMQEVEGVVSLFQPQAKEKGISIETSIEHPIPQQIESDPKRMRQVLINLMGNAVKFTSEGRVLLKIWVEKKDPLENSFLCFSIADTGCGIPKEAHEKLFQPFMQADSSTTRKYGGTGLGLALSRRLARLMGGDIVLADSILGKGSTFIFTINLRGSQPLTIPCIAEMEKDFSKNQIKLTGIKVLVVEDSSDVEELITKFLTFSGAEVHVARNGAEAVSAVESKSFDVVLMDLQMPIMDGYEATQRLRDSGFNLPIIALTAHAMSGEEEKCSLIGFSDFLMKPLNVEKLLSTIQKFGKIKV